MTESKQPRFNVLVAHFDKRVQKLAHAHLWIDGVVAADTDACYAYICSVYGEAPIRILPASSETKCVYRGFFHYELVETGSLDQLLAIKKRSITGKHNSGYDDHDACIWCKQASSRRTPITYDTWNTALCVLHRYRYLRRCLREKWTAAILAHCGGNFEAYDAEEKRAAFEPIIQYLRDADLLNKSSPS